MYVRKNVSSESPGLIGRRNYWVLSLIRRFFATLFILGGFYRRNLSIRLMLITDALQKVALIKSQWNLITNHFDNYSCNIGVVLNCKAIKPLSRHIKHVFMRPLMRSSHKVTQKWNFNNHVFLVGMDSHPKFPNNLIEARQYRTVVGARGFILRVHFLIVMLSPIFYSWWMYQIFKKNLRIVMMIFIW